MDHCVGVCASGSQRATLAFIASLRGRAQIILIILMTFVLSADGCCLCVCVVLQTAYRPWNKTMWYWELFILAAPIYRRGLLFLRCRERDDDCERCLLARFSRCVPWYCNMESVGHHESTTRLLLWLCANAHCFLENSPSDAPCYKSSSQIFKISCSLFWFLLCNQIIKCGSKKSIRFSPTLLLICSCYTFSPIIFFLPIIYKTIFCILSSVETSSSSLYSSLL